MSDLRNDMEAMRRKIEARKRDSNPITFHNNIEQLPPGYEWETNVTEGSISRAPKQMKKKGGPKPLFHTEDVITLEKMQKKRSNVNSDQYLLETAKTMEEAPENHHYEIRKGNHPDAKAARVLVRDESKLSSFFSYNYVDVVLAANEILINTEAEGGYSFIFDLSEIPETGFIVGDNQFSIQLKVDENTVLIDLLEETIAMLYFAQVGQYHGVGTWVDVEESILYIDPIMWFESEEEAISVAMRNGEKAIFECATQESLELV